MPFQLTNPIAIGSDHAGFAYKTKLIQYLNIEKGVALRDFGAYSDTAVDYPDVAHPVADAVESGAYSLGILLCGSANGVAITANKHAQIRAAICWTVELAKLARQHNHANILCLPARFISLELAILIVDAFLDTPFEGGRHNTRVDKIALG